MIFEFRYFRMFEKVLSISLTVFGKNSAYIRSNYQITSLKLNLFAYLKVTNWLYRYTVLIIAYLDVDKDSDHIKW